MKINTTGIKMTVKYYSKTENELGTALWVDLSEDEVRDAIANFISNEYKQGGDVLIERLRISLN